MTGVMVIRLWLGLVVVVLVVGLVVLAGTNMIMLAVNFRVSAILVAGHADCDDGRIRHGQLPHRRRGHRNERQQQPSRQDAAESVGAAKCVHASGIVAAVCRMFLLQTS
jgi:hypothetical protein